MAKGIIIPGYAFVSEYLSDKAMHELGQGDFKTNLIKSLPECFLIEAGKVYIGAVLIYGFIL